MSVPKLHCDTSGSSRSGLKRKGEHQMWAKLEACKMRALISYIRRLRRGSAKARRQICFHLQVSQHICIHIDGACHCAMCFADAMPSLNCRCFIDDDSSSASACNLALNGAWSVVCTLVVVCCLRVVLIVCKPECVCGACALHVGSMGPGTRSFRN